MPLSVMGVVLLAALLHAAWNFLVKSGSDKHLGMTAVVLGHTPFALAALLCSPLPRPESVPWIVAGAALHAAYQLFLLHSYRLGDLSQVYPLARGASPLLVAAASVLLLGVSLSGAELLAIGLIAAGIISLALVRQGHGLRNGQAAALALATGACIASYSLVDGLGARQAGTALGFYGWLSVGNAVLFGAAMRVLRPGTLRRTLRAPRLALCGGGASFAAYALVIWAFTQAPIALVTALRETSIVFALLLGVFVLKERLDLAKVAATMLTLVGVGMLRIKR